MSCLFASFIESLLYLTVFHARNLIDLADWPKKGAQ